MIVNLLRKDSLTFITLPDRIRGQYWLADKDEGGRSRNLIGIESEDGSWVLKSNKTAWLVDGDNKRMEKTVLRPMSFIHLAVAV